MICGRMKPAGGRLGTTANIVGDGNAVLGGTWPLVRLPLGLTTDEGGIGLARELVCQCHRVVRRLAVRRRGVSS